jgi:hypothetical protein
MMMKMMMIIIMTLILILQENMTVSKSTKKASVVAKSIKKLEEDVPRRANKARALSDESYELGKDVQDSNGEGHS